MTENTVAVFNRFRNGDDDAAELLFAKYFDRLDEFAGRRMSDPLQRRVGSDDIAQSVYRSFFLKAKAGDFHVQQSGQLWKLLAALAHRKILQNVEWHGKAKKRSFNKEQAVAEDDSPLDIVGDAINPAQQSLVDDAIESVLNAVSVKWKTILAMSEKQHRVKEIAEQLGESESEVRRVLILRMKCAAGLENEDLSELLECSVVTVRRMWRDLLALAESLAAAGA